MSFSRLLDYKDDYFDSDITPMLMLPPVVAAFASSLRRSAIRIRYAVQKHDALP